MRHKTHPLLFPLTLCSAKVMSECFNATFAIKAARLMSSSVVYYVKRSGTARSTSRFIALISPSRRFELELTQERSPMYKASI